MSPDEVLSGEALFMAGTRIMSNFKNALACVALALCFVRCASHNAKGRLQITYAEPNYTPETNSRRTNFSNAMTAMRIKAPAFSDIHETDPFMVIIEDLAKHSDVQLMATLEHHKDSTLEHSLTVARVSYYLAKAFGFDEKSTARGALLHDFFLYEWNDGIDRNHRTTHPNTALKNARERFVLNPVEQDIILTHMWPVVRPFYSFKESFLVSIVDKMVSVGSIWMIIGSKLRNYRTTKEVVALSQ